MNNCFSAPTAEPPQWGKGASNYSGVGVFTFLFLKLRAVLVPWGAVWVGLGWGLEVSFGLPGFCMGGGSGGVCPFLSLLAGWGVPGRAGRCHRWLGLPLAAGMATGELGGTCEVKQGRGGGSLELPPAELWAWGVSGLSAGFLPTHWGWQGPACFLPCPQSHSAHGPCQDLGRSGCLPAGPLAFEVQACFLPHSVGI